MDFAEEEQDSTFEQWEDCEEADENLIAKVADQAEKRFQIENRKKLEQDSEDLTEDEDDSEPEQKSDEEQELEALDVADLDAAGSSAVVSSGEIEILESNKGKPKLSKDGYLYHLNKKRGNVYYWSCVRKRSKREHRCRATAVSNELDGHHSFQIDKRHNHVPNQFSAQRSKLRQSLKDRSSCSLEVPSVTIAECAKSIPPEVQTMVTKAAQKKLCQRSRHPTSNRPKNPKQDKDYSTIPEKYTRTLDNVPFLLANLETKTGRTMIFSTHDNIRRLAAANVWMLDGTFSTAPEGFTQIYTILGSLGVGDATRFLPLCFMLLSSKFEETYTEAFEELIKIANTINVELDPEIVLTDYEKAAINTVEKLFPECKPQGCFFHLTQNFYKRVQSLGLSTPYLKDKAIFMAFKKAEALAFIPPNKVSEAFTKLRAVSPISMDDFFTYMEENYVLGRVRKRKNDGTVVRVQPSFPVELWNVYHAVLGNHPRTTNRLEGWHNRWRTIATETGFYKIIENLQKEQKLTEGEVLSTLQGQCLPKRNAKQLEKDVKLKALADKFLEMDLMDYLTGVALILKDY